MYQRPYINSSKFKIRAVTFAKTAGNVKPEVSPPCHHAPLGVCSGHCMAFGSYYDFVRALEAAGELKRITAPIATELEITEIADREMKKTGGGKALLFEKPTVNGKPSPFPVAINTLGSAKRMAMSLGAE